MKRLLWILALLPVASCSDSGTPVDVQPVRIGKLKLEDDRFSFVLKTERGDRHVRTARIAGGLTSRIDDAEGRPLFEVSVEVTDGGVVMTESTDRDRLRMQWSQTDDTVREHFVYNGRQLALTYPKLDPVTMIKSVAHYERGNRERVHPELLRALIDFEAFYRPNDSLHGNAEGDALVTALLSDELAGHLRGARAGKAPPTDAPGLAHGKDMSLYCAVVGIGTGLKCFFGGAANPVCLVGAYHSIACGLVEIVCSLWWSC